MTALEFVNGVAVHSTADANAPAWDYSVVSTGTELRRLRESRDERSCSAGYIACRLDARGTVIAPAPHGRRSYPVADAMIAPTTDPVVVALARFQLMAALGLERLFKRWPEAQSRAFCVLGSGPVALGTVLELSRLEVHGDVVSARKHWDMVCSLIGGSLRNRPERDIADFVIEAAGSDGRAAALACRPEGVVGLLGLPEWDPKALVMSQRKNLTLFSMHELCGHTAAQRQRELRRLVEWLGEQPWRGVAPGWIRVTPGAESVGVYEDLQRCRRDHTIDAFTWTDAGTDAWARAGCRIEAREAMS